MAASYTSFGGSTQVVILQNQLPLMSFDASVNENHQRRSVATKFETENAQTLSDHVVIEPFRLTLKVLSTDSPFNFVSAAVATAATRVLQQSNLVVNAAGAVAAAAVASQALASLFSPSLGTYRQLLALQDGKFPFDVFTTIGLYRNMWIENLSVPRDGKTGAGLFFDLELVQLLLVAPVSLNTAIFAAADLAAGQAEKGPQGAFAPSAVSSAAQGTASALNLLAAPP